jgi:peptidoglycan/xylan/chitin deacetylase (PgdA/CDA1 family)
MKFRTIALSLLCSFCIGVFAEPTELSSPINALTPSMPTPEDYQHHKQKHKEQNVIHKMMHCQYASEISSRPPTQKISLTFDDGPAPNLTPKILDLLAEHHVRATFFMTGVNAALYPDLVKRAHDEGHTIGNHSWDHKNFHILSTQDQQMEILKTDAALSLYSPHFFRYPFGNSTCGSNQFVRDKGYTIVGWHIDSCDWAFDTTGSVTDQQAQLCKVEPKNKHSLLQHLLTEIHQKQGGVVLLHDIHPRTLTVLEDLIVTLSHEHYQFVDLNYPNMISH